MPLLGREAAVLCVLMCCVPLQYWLTQRSVVNPGHRTTEVFKLVEEAHNFARNWLTTASWGEWFSVMKRKYVIDDYSNWYSLDESDLQGECPAVEVWQLRNPKGTFGMSPKPRMHRPLGLNWRIGQVVRHKIWKYKGVIIGWDLICKAPEAWIEKMHNGNKHWREQPNYAILVDVGHQRNPQIMYVPQENITPLLKEEINHPELTTYFDSYDGAQYIPSPWLRAIYPLD